MDHYGSVQDKIPLKDMGIRQPFVMPPLTKIAEKQPRSSSDPKWVFFKTPHPNRAHSQLLCTERSRGWAHTHFPGMGICLFSLPLSFLSFLATHTAAGKHRRENDCVSHDTVGELGHGSRGTTW